MNRHLHLCVKILHTKTHPVKPQLTKMGKALGIYGTGINFNGAFGILLDLKTIAQPCHQTRQLVIGQKGRGAPAQMQLRNRRTFALWSGQLPGYQINFFFEVGEVISSLAVVFGNDLIAGAVVAHRVTKGDVNVNCHG